MKQLAVKADGVTRSLDTLIPLIKKDIQEGKRLVSMGIHNYRAAGEKLREARAQVVSREWPNWLRDNFGIHRVTASEWIKLANTEGEYESMTDFRKKTRPHGFAGQGGLSGEIRRIMAGLRVDIDELSADDVSERKEISLMKALAGQVINAGYKVMALKLHPDKGGTNEAMKRLNAVRALLTSATRAGGVFLE